MSKLADLLRQGTRQRERAEVDEITGGGDAHRRGAFAKACSEAQRSTAEEELNRAKIELLENPQIVDTPIDRGHFFANHKDAPIEKLREIVESVHAIRHPRKVSNAPEATPGEFSRRARPSY